MKSLLFETERLIGRQLEPDDYQELLNVYGDISAMRWVDDGNPITPEECKKWLEITEKNYHIYGYGLSAIVERSSGEVIGFCGLVHPGGQKQTEIKYAFKRNYWDRGLATETVRAMLRYGSRAFNLTYVIATVDQENIRSKRVLVKSGMSLIETRKNVDGSETLIFAWRKGNNEDEI